MYEQFFGMAHTPFSRDVPPEALYESGGYWLTYLPNTGKGRKKVRAMLPHYVKTA